MPFCVHLKKSKRGILTKLLNLYRRYIDDTITAMPDVAGAESFLSTLNECHPSITFTMELARQNKLSFLGMEIKKNGFQLSTNVYRKPINAGLLLHFHILRIPRYAQNEKYSCQSGDYSGQAYFKS